MTSLAYESFVFTPSMLVVDRALTIKAYLLLEYSTHLNLIGMPSGVLLMLWVISLGQILGGLLTTVLVVFSLLGKDHS